MNVNPEKSLRIVNALLKISSIFLFVMFTTNAILTFILMRRGVQERNPIIVFLFEKGMMFILPISSLIVSVAICKTVGKYNRFKTKCAIFAVLFVLCYVAAYLEWSNLNLLRAVS